MFLAFRNHMMSQFSFVVVMWFMTLQFLHLCVSLRLSWQPIHLKYSVILSHSSFCFSSFDSSSRIHKRLEIIGAFLAISWARFYLPWFITKTLSSVKICQRIFFRMWRQMMFNCRRLVDQDAKISSQQYQLCKHDYIKNLLDCSAKMFSVYIRTYVITYYVFHVLELHPTPVCVTRIETKAEKTNYLIRNSVNYREKKRLRPAHFLVNKKLRQHKKNDKSREQPPLIILLLNVHNGHYNFFSTCVYKQTLHAPIVHRFFLFYFSKVFRTNRHDNVDKECCNQSKRLQPWLNH